MKHLNKLLVAVMIVMGLTSHAQDSNNPWALAFGVNAVDTRTSAGQEGFHHFDQMYNVKDNWNILPSVSYLKVSKFVGSNFSVSLQGSVNKMDKFVVDVKPVLVTNPGDLMYYGIDGAVRYSFANLIKSKVIDPSVNLGGGYTFLGKSSYGTVNGGVGLTFWLSENVGLEFGTTYKKSFGDRMSTVGFPISPSYFQHTAGIVFKFGGKDTDGDGIYDKDDACPEVAGLAQFNGCPDTDGDGIQDSEDACPDIAGLASLKGCPDSDGDGIADKDDACPDVAGLAALKGCPDADGDGVADKDDKCPTVAGPKDNAGCPWPDTDKDGVYDKDDMCPTVAGPASNKGCPEVTAEAMDELNMQARFIYFNSGKSTFKEKDVPQRLDAMAEVLKNYPNSNFLIEGHTDSDGSNEYNQGLSDDRAAAVKEALVQRGINSSKISTVGFGETTPVSTNKTAAGKALNRRTEVKLVK
ncbi:OmpA family protein [Flavobacterium sp.]|uniref:OmpA family protein n=1 Tax=Flavobacterium sp. TaxID=239 RepID=UPI002601D8FD|nr:OmpA family protein [Flavobacterium sp.]MDG2431660.1 OmpA family protein [Flavobacterium sp.]